VATKKVTTAQYKRIKADSQTAAMHSNMSAGWEKASGRGTNTAISFPSTMSTPDVGSRTAPIASAGPRHLSGPQFSGNANLAGLHANLSAAGYAAGPSNNPQSGMEGYRSHLKQAMLGSAGSSQHSLGAALNADPTMFGGEHQAVIGNPGNKGGGGLLNKLVGKKNSPRSIRRVLRIKPSPHAGKNAANLRAATGAK
jgi:hypothetical protein